MQGVVPLHLRFASLHMLQASAALWRWLGRSFGRGIVAGVVMPAPGVCFSNGRSKRWWCLLGVRVPETAGGPYVVCSSSSKGARPQSQDNLFHSAGALSVGSIFAGSRAGILEASTCNSSL